MENLVSIILPTYNGEKFLKDSIESILKQTYTNWELIIVNDCSTDNTLKIIEEYAQKDARIKYISNKVNSKLPQSLNNGFKLAKGEYYTWTSDDNMYKPNAIKKMVEYLNENPTCDLVSFNFDFITEDCQFEKKLTDYFPTRNMLQLATYCNVGACFMYRKEIAAKVGEYDTEMFCAEDYDYWCRIAINGNIHYNDENLYMYRNNPQSLTATKSDVIQKRTNEIRKKYALKILEKCGFNKKQQVEYLLHSYKISNEYLYLEIVQDIDKKVFEKLKQKEKIKNFIKSIFSLSNVYSNSKKYKVISVLGIKIKFRKKEKSVDKKIDYLQKYKLAKEWIEKYTVDNKGICVESNLPKTIYPECTGYYIPTLLKFGDKERAVNFGNYLISIQNEDGSWNEQTGKIAYTFDTAQILKGLVSLIEHNLDEKDKYKNALLKGCDWILSMQRENGSIATPDYSYWGLPYGKRVPEAIHVYCLEPLRKTAKMFGINKYEVCVQKALNYYLSLEDLTDFKTLSHFNAYIIEGLIDLGEINRAKRAMDLISLHQRLDGSVSAYSHVDFVCSTGLLQYAICWYKLGEIEKADKAFDYVCNLQNKSGGWYGSYTVARDKANYFPDGEIDWAVKYFLDAIYFRTKVKYDTINWSNMWSCLQKNDERYSIIENEVANESVNTVLDLGCGKGRYTKKLIEKYPNKKYCCVDITEKLFKEFEFNSENKIGTILDIPYPNNYFDCVFICEALEHCIDLDNAIKEIARVVKTNGRLIIIDKNIKSLGQLELADFEQWFDEKALCKKLENNGFTATVKSNIEYENGIKDGLFSAWQGVKK